MARIKPAKLSIKNDYKLIIPKFRKALEKISKKYVVDDTIYETYENYKFYINGEVYRFFKMGKVSQIDIIMDFIETKEKFNQMMKQKGE